LGLGINCPLIGEAKYNPKKKNVPIKLGERVMEPLGLDIKDRHNFPMSIHLAEVLVPLSDGSRFSVVKAEYPPLFAKIIKCLSLLKK
jgi:hypothetical protein